MLLATWAIRVEVPPYQGTDILIDQSRVLGQQDEIYASMAMRVERCDALGAFGPARSGGPKILEFIHDDQAPLGQIHPAQWVKFRDGTYLGCQVGDV